MALQVFTVLQFVDMVRRNLCFRTTRGSYSVGNGQSYNLIDFELSFNCGELTFWGFYSSYFQMLIMFQKSVTLI